MRANIVLVCALVLAGPAWATGTPGEPPVFLLKWGTPGSGPGQFDTPRGVATDAAGNVYVADQGNHRIQRFTANGVFLGEWGSFGQGLGQFDLPMGVTVGPDGNVYVADRSNNRVQVFTATGRVLRAWGLPGPSAGEFNRPEGIAVDGAGNVYVSDTFNGRIQKFTSTGVFLTQWGRGVVSSPEPGEFVQPEGIAVDGFGNVYVADLGCCVNKFTDTGAFVTRWILLDPVGSNMSPFYVAVGAHGHIYASYVRDHVVVKFAPDGKPLSQLGTLGRGGSADGQFLSPTGVAVDTQGNLYVAESEFVQIGNDRVQKFGEVATSTETATWGRIKALYR